DLGDGPKPIGAHADRHADDAGFVDRRVEAARLAILALQPVGAAKDAAEIADILAEHDHALVLGHLAIHRVADRLDHRHARHALDSERSTLSFGRGVEGERSARQEWPGPSALIRLASPTIFSQREKGRESPPTIHIVTL